MKTKFYLLTAGLLAAVMVFAQPSGSGKSGKFSVAAGVQVRFAQGNLQFNPSQGTHATAEGTASGTWRFAEQQYESFQDENVNIVNAGYNGWLDLFGWGTSGYNSCSPLTYLPDATYGDGNLDIAGTYYDWGVYNAISNGGNKVGLWRTLTESEWEYLTLNRANAANLWSLARVNNIDGLLILPDDWSLPSGLSFSPQQQYPSHNAYTLEQWQQMENAGAVFLPAEGYRSYNTSTSQVTVKTNYRRYSTSSCATATQRYTIVILPFTATPAKNWKRDKNEGWAVRLARTIEEYTVVFKDWDGTVLSNGNVEYGFAATPPANPTREGFTFTSWGPSVSGMNVNYITGEVVFTAQYEKYITYTVTFVDGLTGDVISTLTKEQGATLTLSERPSTPTHDGNIFEGETYYCKGKPWSKVTKRLNDSRYYEYNVYVKDPYRGETFMAKYYWLEGDYHCKIYGREYLAPGHLFGYDYHSNLIYDGICSKREFVNKLKDAIRTEFSTDLSLQEIIQMCQHDLDIIPTKLTTSIESAKLAHHILK